MTKIDVQFNKDLEALRASMEKTDAIKAFCQRKGIEYWEDVHVGNTGIIIPLYLPKYRIAVRIGDDSQWYDTVKRCVHPIFIRETDTVTFVLEKVKNTISSYLKYKKSRTSPKTSYQRKMAKRAGKRINGFLSSLRADKKYAFKKSK